jgi:NDP-sugar pyrophosphorylase family protein
MKAIMLAAGEGTRCYPFTYLSPKICQQVVGIPLVEFMLSWFGGTPEIEKLYIVLRTETDIERVRHYVSKRKLYFGNIVSLFEKVGYAVDYCNPDFEIEPVKARGWGTGGDLKLAISQIQGELSEDFMVCNADYVIARRLKDGRVSPQLNLGDVIKYHRDCKNSLGVAVTLAVIGVPRQDATRFGVTKIKKMQGYDIIDRFLEKPPIEDIPENPLINAGISVLDRDFFLANQASYLPEGPNVSLERMMYQKLAGTDIPRLAAFKLDLEQWFDVGSLDQLVEASIFIASRRLKYHYR